MDVERAQSEPRSCGTCSLCCQVLRVDEIGKRGGEPCRHQRAEGGCGIYTDRPGICRGYRCMWLQGRFADEDRPDRLGAIIDLLNDGMNARLSIQEARPGAFDASIRLREIVEQTRESMPVRVVEAGNEDDPDRPFRVYHAGGLEQRVRGDLIAHYRDGVLEREERLPIIERGVRRVAVWLRKGRLALARRNTRQLDR